MCIARRWEFCADVKNILITVLTTFVKIFVGLYLRCIVGDVCCKGEMDCQRDWQMS